MESVMANQVDEKQWYLAVGDRSLGPLSTDLVARGIKSGKVPSSAWVCQVGDSSWSAISSFGEFQDALTAALGESPPANEGGLAGEPDASLDQATHAQEANDGEAATENQSEDPDEPTGRRSLLPYEQVGSVVPPEPTPDADGAVARRNARGIDYAADYAADGAALPSFESDLSEPQASPFEGAGVTGHSTRLPIDADEGFDSVFGPAVSDGREHNSYSDISEQRAVDPMLRLDPFTREDQHEKVASSLGGTPTVRAALGALGEDSREDSREDSSDDLGIDIVFDEDESDSINWKERFQSYFLVGQDVQLPDEQSLLDSLRETPRTIFLHDEALWNLALCLAFGSDVVAQESALTFFDALTPDEANAGERVQWICRTLLSKGFMPSGIPRMEGLRGIDVLRQICPIDLQELLERESSSS